MKRSYLSCVSLSLLASLFAFPAFAVSDGASEKTAEASAVSDRGSSRFDAILSSLLKPAETADTSASGVKQDAPVPATNPDIAPVQAPTVHVLSQAGSSLLKSAEPADTPASGVKQDASVPATNPEPAPIQAAMINVPSQIVGVPGEHPLEEKTDEEEIIRISLGGGYLPAPDRGKKGWCVQGEILFSIPQTPVDIDIRGFYNGCEFQEYYGLDESMFLGSAQLRLNLNRNGINNPYISCGAYYQRHNWDERKSDYYWVLRRWYWYKKWYSYNKSYDDDDVDFIASVGIEIKPDPLYLRLDCSVLDSSQFEILAIVGINLTDRIRLEGAYRYSSLNYLDDDRYDLADHRQCFLAGLSVGF